MSERTAKVKISAEAKVLRQMRITKGLSMRAAGALIGRSDSYISQLENGRMDIPTGAMLELIVRVLGPVKVASFKERARLYKEVLTPREEVRELLEKLREDQVRLVMSFLQAMMG